MKNLISALALGATFAALTTLSHAQSLTDTVTIEGELVNADHSFLELPQLSENASFIATLELDRFAPLSAQSANVLDFQASVLSINVVLYSDQNMLLDTGAVPTSCDGIVSSPESLTKALGDGITTLSGFYQLVGGDMNGRTQICDVTLDTMLTQLFPTGFGFPAPLAGPSDAAFSSRFWVGSDRGSQSVIAFGVARSISVESLDTDQDGVADWDDHCASSDLSATVVFDGEHDSGVTNYTDASGCTIMDHYASCAEPTSSFFSYSGPSYCEQQVAYQLYREGVIDYADVRALRSALN